MKNQKVSIALALAAVNLAIGGIVSWLKLPIYLDSIGLIVSTALLGWQYGLLTGVTTIAVGFFLINPYLPAYSGTMCAIVIAAEVLTRKSMFKSLPRSILSGLIIALIAAIISAPVTAYLFGGVTASGADLITAIFRKLGGTILESVFLSGMSSEVVDKGIAAVVAYLILRALPQRLHTEFRLRPQAKSPVS